MSMEDIEKQHAAATKAVGDLEYAIESHIGVPVLRLSVCGGGEVFCRVVGADQSVSTLHQSLADMVAEAGNYHPDRIAVSAKRRLAAIDKERAELVAQLEGNK